VIEQTGMYTFRINGRDVDFSSALSLPELPGGSEALAGEGLGWLANHGWALKIHDATSRKAFKKIKQSLK